MVELIPVAECIGKYYLNDHLGNTRVSFGGHSNGNPEIMQVTDYYPFGMVMAQQNFVGAENALQNKYLYNGKELQDDNLAGAKLDWYDYGARFYDAALGRFHTQDRFAEKYSSITPYQYGANNPALFIDVNGDSLWIKRAFHKALLYENGNLYNKDGSAYIGKQRGFLKNTVSALDKTRGGGGTGEEMVSDVQSSKFSVTIKRGSSNGYKADNGMASLNVQAPGKFPELAGSGGTIRFNPQSFEGGMTTRGNRDSQPFIGLSHELAHSWDGIDGNLNIGQVPGQDFTYSEQFSTHIENKIRAENGMPLRTHYGYDATNNAGFYRVLQPGGQSTFYGNNYYDDLKLKSIMTPIPVQAVTPTIIIK